LTGDGALNIGAGAPENRLIPDLGGTLAPIEAAL
jgi:hypothetical protein